MDWDSIGRLWGPLGVGFVLFILLALGLFRAGHKLLNETIEDARKERDSANARSERQADKFLESLKVRDDLMKDGFDEVLREIRSTRQK